MNEPAGKPPHVSNKLNIPEGVGPSGPFMDMTEAYVKSVVAVPAMLQAITEALMDIADSMGVFAIYLEKKGIAEGTLNNDDLDHDEDDDSSTEAH